MIYNILFSTFYVMEGMMGRVFVNYGWDDAGFTGFSLNKNNDLLPCRFLYLRIKIKNS